MVVGKGTKPDRKPLGDKREKSVGTVKAGRLKNNRRGRGNRSRKKTFFEEEGPRYDLGVKGD